MPQAISPQNYVIDIQKDNLRSAIQICKVKKRNQTSIKEIYNAVTGSREPSGGAASSMKREGGSISVGRKKGSL